MTAQNFTFPEIFCFKRGLLRYRNQSANFPKLDISNYESNIVTIDGIDYIVNYIHLSGSNKGGNSIILKLYELQNFDSADLDYSTPDKVLKINREKLDTKKASYYSRGQQRFAKEIEALIGCQARRFQNVIEILDYGICKVKSPFKSNFEEYLYYTMSPAEYDLKSYIEANHLQLTLDSKLALCLSLSQGLKDLYSLGYYHRDLKPDNIFIVDDDWKIGDLGLLSERELTISIDKVSEFVGPRGWISPETMNKYLTENKGFLNNFDCRIDHQSDIFQLGKIFWYIFQHNSPVGTVKRKDFLLKDETIYALIKTMLNYDKKKRYRNIEEVIYVLNKITNRLLISA